MPLKASELEIGATHTARLVEDLKRTQIVQYAGALMNRPRILLADEPTGSLDEKTSASVFDMLLELTANEGVTLIMATHDRGLAARCNRLVEMHDGRIRESLPI